MLKTLLRSGKKIPKYPHIFLSKLGLGAALFRLEMHFLFTILGWGWLQRVLFGARLRLIGRFLRDTGLDSIFDCKDFVRFSLAGSAATHWWFDALRHWNDQDFDQVVTVQGWEHFSRAHAKGKGIVLVHHHLIIAHVIWVLLEKRGYRDRQTIGKLVSRDTKEGQGQAGSSDAIANSMNYLRQLQSARAILAKGGIVRIVPDGFRGNSAGTEFLFFNRLRVFRAGFADLALLTAAEIILTSVSMDRAGTLTVTFTAPLRPVQNADRKTQSADLVAAYVRYLEAQWNDPSLRFMSIPNIRKFVELPLVQVDKQNES